MNTRTESVFVLANINKLQKFVIAGINNYLNDQMVQGDRDGTFHGKKGQNRALKLKKYFENNLSTIDTLALLLAVFGKPSTGIFGWLPSPGRSSRLAGLIADQLIIGAWEHGLARRDESLASAIFSAKALKEAADEIDNSRVVPMRSIFTYFDKTLGVRYLLNKALNNEFKKQSGEIHNIAKKLSAKLDDNSDHIDLTLLTDTKGEMAFIEGAVVGAMKKGKISSKIPEETSRIIGSFLSRGDASKLVQTTKSALDDARAERKFVKG